MQTDTRRRAALRGAVLAAPILAFTGLTSPAAAQSDWGAELAQPFQVAASGPAYLNLSFDALFAAGGSTRKEVQELQLGGHDPNQRGFTVQNLELTLDGAVDPYLRGQANLVFQIDAEGESFVEVEEAYLVTQSLPANLQLKAGQFLTEFGRLNPTHPHTWGFADLSLVNGRLLGGDGLRGPGVQLSWLLPLPFYSELFLAVQNSQGETAFSFRNSNEGEPLFGRVPADDGVRGLEDLLYTTRGVASFDLTDQQTLMVGASGAIGPNATGSDSFTRIAGVDLYWKWTSPHGSRGYPFVSLQAEGMYRSFEAGAFEGSEPDADASEALPPLPAETLEDWGYYAQLLWGFTPGWVAGLRGERVDGARAAFDPDPLRAARTRISPNLTWHPTHFSKLRLQYNFDEDARDRIDHSVWLQWEFLLGAHPAHTF